MTGSNRHTYRALVLSALMVLSVVAGTVAFSGGAAGAATNASLSPSTAAPGDTVTVTTDDDSDTDGDTIQAVLDVDGDGMYDEGEPAAEVTGYTNGGSDITVGDLTVPSDADDGDYTVYVHESNGGISPADDVDLEADADTSTTLTVDSSGPSIRKVLHYDDNPADGVQDPVVEIAFETDDIDASTIEGEDFTLYDEDDDEIATISNIQSGSNDGQFELTDGGGRLIIHVGAINTEVDNIDIPGTIADGQGNQLDADGETVNEDVTVGAQTVDATGPDTDGLDTTDVSYRGTNIAVFVGENTRMSWDGPGGYTLRRSSGENSLVYVWNTRNLDFGDYDIDTGETGQPNANVSLEDLGLTVNLDEDSYNDEEIIDGNVTMSAINRPVTVELQKGGDTKQTRVLDVDADGTADFEFDATDSTGNYTVLATDNTSGITDESDEFRVSGAADNEASFAQGSKSITEQRGDIANITVRLQGTTDMVTLAVGDADEDNYQATIVAEDGDDDGEIKFQFNTYTAGRNVADDELVTVADDDDEIESVDQNFTDLGMLDAKDNGYTMSAKATEVTGGDVVDNPDNIGTLFLEERDVGTSRSWTVPSEESTSDFDNVSDIQAAVEDGILTQSSNIAFDDYYVQEVQVGGIGGLLEYEAGGGDDSAGLENAIEAGTLRMDIEQTGDIANVDENTYDVQALLEDGDAIAVYADDANRLYVVMPIPAEDDQGEFDRTPEDGDQFESNFTVAGNRILDRGSDNERRGLATADVNENNWENSTATFTLQERTLDFESDPYNVSATEDATIEGSTSVAPGTEIRIRAQSTGDTQPRFIYTNESVVVQPDGTFSTTFDFSNQSAGDTFDLTATGVGIDEEIDGNVVEAVETTTETTETETTEETTTETTTEETTTEETTTAPPTETTTEETTTQQQTPGFGVAVAVVALLAAALLAIRRD